MKNVRLTKISDCENPLYVNHIQPGYIKEGIVHEDPKVGQSFEIGGYWSTSTVTEILSDNTFKTRNSIYKWEVIEFKQEETKP